MTRFAIAFAFLFSLVVQTRTAAAADPVVVAPHIVEQPAIPYPEGAHGDARVVLHVIIGVDGAVRSATAEEGAEPFATHAVKSVSAFRYEPATRDGHPIEAKIRVEIAFHEPEAPAADPAPLEEAPPKADAPIAPPATDEVRIKGERGEPGRTASLSRAEVREIPGTFGDPFRAIEIMPGVTPIVSGLPFFFVRGAPPGNVGYFVDGVRVPLLFHVGAGPSVIHPGLMSRVDLYPGGYPARFGRFSGGIVSGETTERATRFGGEYNIRLFDAGALLETPFANGRGSVQVGGRYSYTAALLSRVATNTVLDYWDYQARASYDLTKDDRASVFVFGSYDYLGQKTTSGSTLTLFGTEFHRADARWDHRLGERGGVRVAATVGLDRTRLDEGRFLRDRIAGARTELGYQLGSNVLLRAGTDVQIDAYDVVLGDELGPNASRAASYFPSRTDYAFGARGDLVIEAGRLSIIPGARIDLWSSQGTTALGVDPRAAMRLRLADRLHLLSAFGVAHQPPAFVIPVPGFQPGGLAGGLQKSVQESAGAEIDLGDQTILTLTGFHNAFFNMSDPLGATQRQLNGCPPGAFPGTSLAGDSGGPPQQTRGACGAVLRPGVLGPDGSGGGGQAAEGGGASNAASAFEVRTLGSAWGLEVFLKRKLTRRIGGFVSYTLSRSTRSNGNKHYVATFDRTHVANAALAYDLGKGWRAGARLVFYTGLPKAPDPTDPDATRLPPFYRADLRLEKKWTINEHAWFSVVAEWMNATLTKEAVATTCTLQGCQAQTIGPITIPSLGVEGGF